jgi:hypothetical protein
MLNIISLGAGVQSSTMALMAAKGEITPMPDCAIFADTGNEPEAVYNWLGYLTMLLPFEVMTVSAGNLLEDYETALIERTRMDNAPFFTDSGPIRRGCTVKYKIQPLRRKARALAGISGKKCSTLEVSWWQGISTDEIQRARASTENWQEYRYPLLEQKMNRGDCLKWMEDNGYQTPPRSACIICPYHSDYEWQNLTDAEFHQAVQFDRLLTKQGIKGVDKPVYLHHSATPLESVDFTNGGQVDLFNEECEGMCGI